MVIPFYDVDQYFDECISSVRHQTHRRLQIILVDDGSPDDSLRIAREHAAEDSRIQIVEKANGGLGQARNVGTRFVTGEYLLYLDSDDSIVPNAVATLVKTLRSSGSDFAVCAFRRFTDSGRTWDPDWIRTYMRFNRVGTTIDEVPDLLGLHNVMWAKMFRTDFFREYVIGCPEGIRYEDQEPSARAFVHARSFDIVSQRLFNWRVRKDGTSLSQQKHSLADVTDRLGVISRVGVFLRSNASSRVYEHWAVRIASHDLALYLEQVPRVSGDDYWHTLREGIAGFVSGLTPGAWDMLDVHSRVLLEAVDADHRSDILTVLAHVEDHGRPVRVEPVEEGLRAFLPYADELVTRVSATHLHVPDESISARIGLLALRWRGGTTLAISGWGYLDGLSSDDPTFDVTLELVNQRDRTRLSAAVTRMVDPVVQAWSADSYNNQSCSAFEAVVDLEPVLRWDPAPGSVPDKWMVEVSVTCLGVVRKGPFAVRIADGNLAQVPLTELSGGARIVAEWSPAVGLVLAPKRPTWILRRCSLEGRRLMVEFRHVDGLVPTGIVVDHGGVTAESDSLEVDEEAWAAACVSVPPAGSLDRDGVQWRVRVLGPESTPERLCWAGDSASFYEGQGTLGRLHPRLTHHGYLRLDERAVSVVVTRVDLGDDRLAYGGFLDAGGAGDPQLLLDDGVDAVTPSAFDWDRRSLAFTAVFDPAGATGHAARKVNRGLVLVSPGLEAPHMATILETASCELPAVVLTDRVRARVSRTFAEAQPRLTAGPPLKDSEVTTWGRQRLLAVHRDGPHEVSDRTWLFESYFGRLFTDSPRSIFEELRRREVAAECFFTVTDVSAEVPSGCTPLLLHSEDYIRVLHSVRYLVNNGSFPHYFRKQPDQFYLQTWHGTPLKRIGEDVPGASLSLSYRSLMKREARYWDALLAQNKFSAEVLPRAFRYAGSVWQMGYPRNDALVSADGDAKRQRVRAGLGIPEGQQVVLYAPTWRDTERSPKGYVLVAHLDFDRVSEALGPETTILLRGHQNTAGTARPAGVVDVTDYPEVNDLFLAADVLITDYSSLMFDFALTGKPILLLVPDLETYRDETRGFYLDLQEVAPGPVLFNDGEVIAELLRLRTGGSWMTSGYRTFRDLFLPQDDGQAARRVVDLLLSARESGRPKGV